MEEAPCALLRGHRATDGLLALQLAHQTGDLILRHRLIAELQLEQAALSAIAPKLADPASVRGESFAKNSRIRAERLSKAEGLRAGSPSIAANNFCMARADGAPRLSLR